MTPRVALARQLGPFCNLGDCNRLGLLVFWLFVRGHVALEDSPCREGTHIHHHWHMYAGAANFLGHEVCPCCESDAAAG